MKKKIIIISIFILLALTILGYYWINGIVSENVQAKVVLSKSQKYDSIKKSIFEEYNRCQGFISQSKGDFGSFEYCKKFIDWTNTKQLTK